MTTLRQIKELCRPLLKKRPDLSLSGRLLVFTPLRHVLRYVHIDQLSGRFYFRVTWGARFMFEPFAGPGALGELVLPANAGLWDLRSEDIAEHLIERLEVRVLPAFEKMATLEEYDAFARANSGQAEYDHERINAVPERALFLHAGLGNLDQAIALAKFCLEPPNGNEASAFASHTVRREIERFYPVLASRDLKAIAAWLKNYEEMNMRRAGVEKLWRPAPYPVELIGD